MWCNLLLSSVHSCSNPWWHYHPLSVLLPGVGYYWLYSHLLITKYRSTCNQFFLICLIALFSISISPCGKLFLVVYIVTCYVTYGPFAMQVHFYFMLWNLACIVIKLRTFLKLQIHQIFARSVHYLLQLSYNDNKLGVGD